MTTEKRNIFQKLEAPLVATVGIAVVILFFVLNARGNARQNEIWNRHDHAVRLVEGGNHELAIEAYDELLSIVNPLLASTRFDVAPFHYYRGLAHLGHGDPDMAILDFDRAIGPNFSFPNFSFRSVLRYMSDKDRDLGHTYLARGRAYLAKNDRVRAADDFDAAIRVATKAIQFDEEDVQAYHLRSEAYRAKGNHDRAKLDHDRAQSIKLPLEQALVGG